MKSTKTKEHHWLLLMHQLPPQPDAFRVKIWRSLQRIGAISLKNSVYVLPKRNESIQAVRALIAQIEAGGGEAFLCEASFLQGMNDGSLIRQFNEERDVLYKAIADDVGPLLRLFISSLEPGPEKLMKVEHSLGRLRRQFDEVASLDYFSAKGKKRAEAKLRLLEKKAEAARHGIQPARLPLKSLKEYQGRTWVTRRNIFVDRLASAWLIRRFIDKKARFKFVEAKSYRKSADDITFDMFDADFGHHGDACTFETLLHVFPVKEAALRPIAEIIHDIDLNDHKFDREETAGIRTVIEGLANSEPDDIKRLARASALFEDLLATFRSTRQRPAS